MATKKSPTKKPAARKNTKKPAAMPHGEYATLGIVIFTLLAVTFLLMVLTKYPL